MLALRCVRSGPQQPSLASLDGTVGASPCPIEIANLDLVDPTLENLSELVDETDLDTVATEFVNRYVLPVYGLAVAIFIDRD